MNQQNENQMAGGLSTKRVATRSEIKRGLKSLFKGQEFYMENSEDFDGHKGGIWMSGESETPNFDGVPVFDYYGQPDGGVSTTLRDWLHERGWFPEWHDAGTMFLWRI